MGKPKPTGSTSFAGTLALTAIASTVLLGGCASHRTHPATTAMVTAGHANPSTQRSETPVAVAPQDESGHEPPTKGVSAMQAPTQTPADHPAAPEPDPGQAPPPPASKASETQPSRDTRFETDLRGETHPGEVVPIGMHAKDDRPLDPSHLCDQRPPDNEQVIDHTRRRVEEMVCTASMWFDGLFGDQYYVAQSRKVYGTVELSNNWSQFYGNKTRLRFDAQVDLPNINHRLSAFIGRDNGNDFIQDRFDNTTLRNSFPQVDDHEKVFAGLGYSLPDHHRLQTNLRAGVRGFAHPEAFLQGRAQLNAYADNNNLINLRATPFWTTRERLGITVGADYSHVLSKKMLLRFGNVGTWAQTTAGLDWRSSLTVYQALLRIKSGIAYEVFVRGETDDDVPIHEYGVQTTFRNPIFGGKLYTEWVLGYSYPRENLSDHRDGSILVGAALQMPFGERHQKQ
ncbi:hypothetical protein [Solimonas marina]|uniref:Uncharacterized protein n=1 Tax=Solimonas marina TaxID=2714601 RepID=A0A970B5R6_9GAMM|nr:hypothetical protein [Solimonas marina]NKF23677.1 hypothetical protein [Solimonas marina]